MKSFKEKYGKWALVTGGTSGIGEEIAKIIASNGINLVLVARREPLLLEKAEFFTSKYNIKVRIIQADLSLAEDYKKVILDTNDLEVGLFVPAAGIENHGMMTEVSVDKELALIQLNITSVYLLTNHFAKIMVERGKGGVILVASTIGHVPNPYFSNYAGSKAYILNFGSSLNWELKKNGVDVTVLSPGYTSTPMTDKMNELDLSKTPMTAMTPAAVAKEAIDALGKKPVIIAGRKNRIMVGMARRLMSSSKAIAMSGKMMDDIL
jgi:short-subunit dehydrogenase